MAALSEFLSQKKYEHKNIFKHLFVMHPPAVKTTSQLPTFELPLRQFSGCFIVDEVTVVNITDFFLHVLNR
ncbi:hypothetical protein [Rothia sp. CCM 9418]|uniref:hypothetical protein n=1 Tax=unclassified Rothia (in: high G+C Gram-positive bacteria) TaxID=2689056 RepID=UPI003ABFF5CC